MEKLQDLDKYTIDKSVKYIIIDPEEWNKLGEKGKIDIYYIENVACEGFRYNGCTVVNGGAFPCPQAILDCRGKKPLVVNSLNIVPSKLPDLRQKLKNLKNLTSIGELEGFISSYPIAYILFHEKEYNKFYNLYSGDEFGLFTIKDGYFAEVEETYQGFKIKNTAILNGDLNKTPSYILYANRKEPYLRELRK